MTIAINIHRVLRTFFDQEWAASEKLQEINKFVGFGVSNGVADDEAIQNENGFPRFDAMVTSVDMEKVKMGEGVATLTLSLIDSPSNTPESFNEYTEKIWESLAKIDLRGEMFREQGAYVIARGNWSMTNTILENGYRNVTWTLPLTVKEELISQC